MAELNHITVVISTRNAVKYIDHCIQSAIKQDYPKFNVIFIDAQSNDGTYERALRYTRKHSDVLTCIQNKERKYQGENIRIGAQLSPERSIIVTLDGDDWFPHNNVLTRINQEYTEHDCWMTYGTYEEYPKRSVSHIYHEYPEEVRKNKTFRQHNWLASHLRTFRRELFLKIDEEDLKDPVTGDYVENVCDLSFQFPMLEMCGVDKSRYISDILYVYNRENPMSDSHKDRKIAQRIEMMLRSKKSYETLERLYDD